MDQEHSQASSETDHAGKDPADQRMVQLARVLMVTKQQVEKLAESVAELSSRHQHIDELSTSLTGRLAELNDTLGATRDAGRMGEGPGQPDAAALGRTGELLEAAAQAGDRIAGVQDQLSERVDRLQDDLTSALKGIESIGSGAERANSRLEEQVFALKGRVTAFADGVEHWFKPAQGEIEANKQYVEQATDQIRQQVSGFEKATRSLQDRIDGGLADLRQRHEGRDDAIAELSRQVDAKLSDCLDKLTNLPQRMTELLTLVKESCVGPADLDGHGRAMQAQIEAAVARLDEQIGSGFAHLVTRFDTADTTRTEIRDNCRAVQQQLGGAIGQLQDGMTSMGEKLSKSLTETLEEQLAAFSNRSEAMTDKMLQRLSQALSSIETRGQRLEQDAALDRARLSEGQGQIETALGQLQTQVTQTLAEFDSHRTAADQQLSGITQQLAELRDQLAAVRPRLDEKIDPLLVAIQKQEQDTQAIGPMITEATSDLQGRLSNVTEQVNACVSRALTGIDTRSREADDASGAQRKELAVGQKELSMAIIRLQGQLSESQAAANDHLARQEQRVDTMVADVSTSLETLSSQLVKLQSVSAGTEVLVSVEQQLGELREQLAMVSTQIESATTIDRDQSDVQVATLGKQLESQVAPVLAAIEEQQRLRNTADARLDQELADLKTQVDAMAAHIGTEVSDALADLKTSSPVAAVGVGAAEMKQLRTELSTITERVDSRVSEVLAELEAHKALPRAGDHAPEQFKAAMDRLEQRLTAVVGDLTVPTGEITRHAERQFDAVQARLSELADRIEAIDSRPAGLQDTPRSSITPPAPPPAPAAVPSTPAEPHRSFSSVLEQLSPEASEEQGDTGQMHDIHHKVADDEHDDDSGARGDDAPPPMSVDLHDDDNSAGTLGVPPPMSMDVENDSSSDGTPAGILDTPPTPPMDEQDDSGPAGILGIAPAPPTDEQDDPVPAGTFDIPPTDEQDDPTPAGTFDIAPTDEQDDPAPAGTLDIPPAPPLDQPDDSRPAGILHVNRDPAPDPDPVQDTPSTPVEEPVAQPAPTDHAGPAGPSPERDPEELIQCLIEAINSGNTDVIRKFVEEEYAESALADGGVDQRVDVYMSIHEEGGECRVVDYDTTPDGLIALVQSRLSLARQRMQIIREQNPPHKILLVNIDEV